MATKKSLPSQKAKAPGSRHSHPPTPPKSKPGGDDRMPVVPEFPYPVTRRVACENRLLRVMFEDFTHNGQSIRNFIVVEPQHAGPEKVGGVAVLAIWNGRVALIRHFRHALAEENWEIPRGFLDPNESPAFSALRELREETGLVCDPQSVIPLGHITPDTGIVRARIALFVATHCKKVGSFAKDEAGHLALRYTPIQTVHRMMVSSKIQDPCSLVAWFRWRAHPSSRFYPVQD